MYLFLEYNPNIFFHVKTSDVFLDRHYLFVAFTIFCVNSIRITRETESGIVSETNKTVENIRYTFTDLVPLPRQNDETLLPGDKRGRK